MAWTPRVNDSVIDNGLSSMKTAATTVWIDDTTMSASTNPTYTEVSSTYAKGSNVGAAGSVFPSVIAAATGGRSLTTLNIVAGTVSATGTVAYWAITDAANVLAVGNLSASQAVTSGNTFTLSPFLITIKYQ